MLSRCGRYLRLKVKRHLMVPLFRARHPPEYTARGVLVGLVVALTPTVGIQMALVGALWVALRALHSRFDFNLLVALAWTWVTNAVTAPFVYYLYIVTGRIMLGRWDELRGYDAFASRFSETMSADAGWLHTFWIYLVNLFDKFGVPLFVGCLPWTVIGAWLGYRWSLRLLRFYHARRERRRRNKLRRRRAAARQAS